MCQINITKIAFPELQLQTRDAHKLRGYFGNLFKEYSPLLHNHYDTGEYRYSYPLVQYKVLQGVPTLIALEEGADLLSKLFLKIKELELDGQKYAINNKNIENVNKDTGYCDALHEYHFATLWMGLNQDNFRKYRNAGKKEQETMLSKILVGNVLSFFKSIGLRLSDNQRLMAKTELTEKETRFKDQKMIAFTGKFVINAKLPEGIGLGKGVSRGFGTITQQNY